jgi:transcription initiation factor TFIIB
MVSDICPNCNNTIDQVIIETGELVCSNCGLVLDDVPLDTSPENRVFTLQESITRKRTGSPLSYSSLHLGITTNFYGNTDAQGKTLQAPMKDKMYRLKRLDAKSKISETWERNLKIALDELDRLIDRLHLGDIIKEKSAKLYRRCLVEDLIRGRSIDDFVAACVYCVCRQNNVPRSLKTVAENSKRNLSDVARTYRLILRELRIKTPVDDPVKYVPKIASSLGLDLGVQNKVIDTLRDLREANKLVGKNPRSVVGAVLYHECLRYGTKTTQIAIAKESGISSVTLRKRYDEILASGLLE